MNSMLNDGLSWNPGHTALTVRLGFGVDVVAFGRRTPADREDVELRLKALLEHVLADIGANQDTTEDDGGTGDGVITFLPLDTDHGRALAGLIGSAATRLDRDNRRYRDRIRLRMAVGSGLIGRGPVGLSGPLIVDLARLVNSAPLRAAVERQPRADLIVLVSNALHDNVIRTGLLECDPAAFHRVDVTEKEFTAPAWLWTSDQPT